MRQLVKITVLSCVLYDVSRRMANKPLFYSISKFNVENYGVWFHLPDIYTSTFSNGPLLIN